MSFPPHKSTYTLQFIANQNIGSKGQSPLKIEATTLARVATLHSSGTQPSSRARRAPRYARIETLDTPESNLSIRSDRDPRARRLEHLEQWHSSISSSVARPTRAGNAVFPARKRHLIPSEVRASLKDNAPANAGVLRGSCP